MKLQPAVAVAALALSSSLSSWALAPLKPVPAKTFATVANGGGFANAWAFNPGAESLIADPMNYAADAGSEIAKNPAKLTGAPLLLSAEPVSGPTLVGSTAVSSAAPTAKGGPEPETYIVLLAGLGAVGFLARRRRFN